MRMAWSSVAAWRWTRAWFVVTGMLMGVMGLSGCDQLGIETPEKAAERQVADAKAVGSACRHAMRAIEDCYLLNPKAEKSAVFTGWREMDEYMRENKLEGIAPVVPRPAPPAAASKPSAPADNDDEDTEEPEAKPGKGKSAKSSGH
ncbi:hypothetical protein AQB9606_04671 [Aquabacterium sp. CECT 9606]|nr:hypothetical protein AQB9606_04671 [Aquabacterium sp. CECT 9606]